MKIVIKDLYEKLIFDLEIENRVTIIRGESATGKSTLLRYIQESENMRINIESPKKLLVTNKESLKNVLAMSKTGELSNDYIYFLDEDDGVDSPEIGSIINNSKNMFVIITRDTSLPNINYGIDQIYEFKKSGKYNILKRKYSTNLNTNHQINLLKLDKIIVEDGGSAFEFYKTLSRFKVNSSFGNSNIQKSLKDNQVVIIDSLGFGPYIKNLNSFKSNKNIFVIYPKSFEWLILESLFGKEKINVETYKNEEDFYYKKLKLVMSGYKRNYSKSKIDGWFTEEPQKSKIFDKIDEIFCINLLKLNKNVGTIKYDEKENILKWE